MTLCSQEHEIEFIQISLKQRILKKGKEEKRKKCGTWKQTEGEKQVVKDI
jgi:hypothetical protein